MFIHHFRILSSLRPIIALKRFISAQVVYLQNTHKKELHQNALLSWGQIPKHLLPPPQKRKTESASERSNNKTITFDSLCETRGKKAGNIAVHSPWNDSTYSPPESSIPFNTVPLPRWEKRTYMVVVRTRILQDVLFPLHASNSWKGNTKA